MRLLEAKLNLLFSLKWKRSDSTYNETAIAYLNKMSDDELEDMYDIVRRKSENENINIAIKDTLLNNINFQKVLKRGGKK